MNAMSLKKKKKLIKSAQQGNAAAWMKVVVDVSEDLHRVAYALLKDPRFPKDRQISEATELFHDTMLHAFSRLETFNRKKPLVPWLAKIMLNRARDRWRRSSRFYQIGEKHLQEVAAHPESSDRVHALDLAAGMRQLPSLHRETLRLLYWSGLSSREVAEVIGRSPRRVRQIRQEAINVLRTLLEAGNEME